MMGIKELYDIVIDDLRAIDDLIKLHRTYMARHRIKGLIGSLDKLKEREDETNR
jgi:hypothetical protein